MTKNKTKKQVSSDSKKNENNNIEENENEDDLIHENISFISLKLLLSIHDFVCKIIKLLDSSSISNEISLTKSNLFLWIR